MADKVSTSSYLAVNFGFEDGDTRLNKIPNPRDDIEESEVAAVSATLLTNHLIVGDKNGAAFSGILTADQYDVVETKFEI